MKLVNDWLAVKTQGLTWAPKGDTMHIYMTQKGIQNGSVDWTCVILQRPLLKTIYYNI